MDNEASTSLYNRIQYYAAVEFLVYWLTGALVWIPFYFSETLGIIGMLVFTPLFILLARAYRRISLNGSSISLFNN